MEPLTRDYPFRTRLDLGPLIDYLDTALEDPGGAKACLREGFREMLKDAPALLEPIEDLTVLERHRDVVRRLMSFVFPPVFWDTEAVGAVVPFSVKPFFVSPLFERLFLDGSGTLVGRLNLDQESFDRGRAIRAYLFILKRFYGIHQELDYPIIRIVPDEKTGLDRHYQLKLDFRFVEAHAIGGPKVLTAEERSAVLEHLTEPEILREILPPEGFELRGFTFIQAVDVTSSEVLSALQRDLINQDAIVTQGGFLQLQQRLRTLFRRPHLEAGLAALREDEILLLNAGCAMTRSCIFADSRHVPLAEFSGTVFERAVQEGKIVKIPDMITEPCTKLSEQQIVDMGVRSLLIAPLHHKDKCIGTLHLGSPEPGDLGSMDALVMSQIEPIFSVAIKKALDDLENQVQTVIKQECTAIHPAVEWRFRNAAFHHLENLRSGRVSEIEPIVFRDVYPLYGASDIRGSTNERNRAIQKDLVEHLNLALKVVESAVEANPLLILRELATRIGAHLTRLQSGLGTGDELSVVQFLRDEVESIFPHLRSFGLKVIRAIEAYQSAIDPRAGTVYRLRRDFEESVSLLNERLTNYLDREEAEIQAAFPHYFERHRTDGVDYLVYMGASLLEHGDFNDIYLKNMRLWQIKTACGLARQTEGLKPSLKVPLDTAHLILVQGTPHSIRFRFDEKRFDVDGAYDTRHEIIKSRIDKAVVKGRRERLTQPGKIAIVFSQPEEANEMLRHVEFLRSEGYLTGETETLELEDLPGVRGLRSLRVGVNTEAQTTSDVKP